MRVLKIVSMVMLSLGSFLLAAGAVLNIVFERTAQVFPGRAYWSYFAASLVIMLAAILEMLWHYRSSSIKLGLLKTVPSLACLPLVVIRLTDPFFMNINLCVLIVFSYMVYRLAVSGFFSESLFRALIPFVLGGVMLACTIVSGLNYRSFDQTAWNIPAAITGLIGILSMIATYPRPHSRLLSFLKHLKN